MAADAPQSHEYFSPAGNPQNLYPQQLDQFARLGPSYTQQQQQQQQQRWAAQLRASQYAAMKQKPAPGLVAMQGQHPQQQMRAPSQPPAYPQQYNPAAGFQPNYPAASPTNTFAPQNNGPGANFPAAPGQNPTQQPFNFPVPGTPTNPNSQQQNFPNFSANGTPNQATREMTGTPGPGPQRDFTPQRGFSDPNPNGIPQRDFSSTPGPGPGRDFSGTPARDFANNNAGAGTPGPQPHAFLPPNRSMAGTPHANMNPMGQGSRTGTPIVRPGTAMSNHGSVGGGAGPSGFGGDANPGMHRGSQPPPTPKIGMGMGMSMNVDFLSAFI
ncbi:hypothetical protein FRC08_012972 [Ceratobasidium sp. 394]|nr:hypothetical protein FRC08_012972 [Ceratobasidium sp. 394]